MQFKHLIRPRTPSLTEFRTQAAELGLLRLGETVFALDWDTDYDLWWKPYSRIYATCPQKTPLAQACYNTLFSNVFTAYAALVAAWAANQAEPAVARFIYAMDN